MVGYRVYDKFDKMSYLITSSCFYKNHEESTDELESSETRYASNSNTQSILEDIGGTRQYSSYNGSSIKC